MGRFYVQEGNKRVSVLKYFGADSIFATVTRVVPQFNDTPEIREYYEFMDYYPLCGLYRLHFTQEGSFARLQKALGKAPDEKWTADDKAEVVSQIHQRAAGADAESSELSRRAERRGGIAPRDHRDALLLEGLDRVPRQAGPLQADLNARVDHPRAKGKRIDVGRNAKGGRIRHIAHAVLPRRMVL